MSKNSDYWEKRIAQHTWNTYNSIEEKNIKLLDMYQQASKDISDELYLLAEKVNNGKGLTRSEMHKYNRLSNLNKNIRDILQDLTNKVAQFSTDNMQESFASNYSNIMNALNIADFALPDKKLMDMLLDGPWRGDSFSKRLWSNTGALANNLNAILTTGLQQGQTVSEMAIRLNNAMNKGFNNAHRLVRTETMHYLNTSSDAAYKDAGITEVQHWAAEDERTCEICAAEHGKVYPIDKAPVLPLHPDCRCTHLPVIKGEKIKPNTKPKETSLPKTIKADDTPLQSTLGSENIKGVIPQGATVKKVRVIAGMNTSTELRYVERLSKTFGGDKLQWQKKGGIINSKYYSYDVHWDEYNGIQYNAKMKGYKFK